MSSSRRGAPKRLPKLGFHKGSGQFAFYLNGQRIYLGTDEARADVERLRLLAEAGAGLPPAEPAAAPGKRAARHSVEVGELWGRYWLHVVDYYRHPNGDSTSEVTNIDFALRPIKKLYPFVRVEDFGVGQLEAIRMTWIKAGKMRKSINLDVNRIKAMFSWGVGKKLVPATVAAELRELKPLRRGYAGVQEGEEVRPVPLEDVMATLPFLSDTLRSMVLVQLWTGARPGEVRAMRPREIDRTGAGLAAMLGQEVKTGGVWAWVPERHKTAHRGKRRVIPVGPKAQALILPRLDRREPDDVVFSSGESLAEFLAARTSKRTTPVYPSELRSRERRKQERAGNARTDNAEPYNASSYATAIARAAEKAGVPSWHPHRLRHTAATLLQRLYGWDVARVVCGHSSVQTTAIYVADDLAKAFEAIGQTG